MYHLVVAHLPALLGRNQPISSPGVKAAHHTANEGKFRHLHWVLVF
jgi:hypothetical protein